MTVPLKMLSEINQEAFHLLANSIGLANTIRFINQFTSGRGNYTEERRDAFAEVTLEDIVSAIEKGRSGRG